MPICWTHPDGSVSLMSLSQQYLDANRQERETVADAVLRLAQQEQAKNPDLVGATPTLIKTADLPQNRTQRHKWRLSNGLVTVDASIPDQPDPKQALREAIDGATTLAQLKTALKNLL